MKTFWRLWRPLWSRLFEDKTTSLGANWSDGGKRYFEKRDLQCCVFLSRNVKEGMANIFILVIRHVTYCSILRCYRQPNISRIKTRFYVDLFTSALHRTASQQSENSNIASKYLCKMLIMDCHSWKYLIDRLTCCSVFESFRRSGSSSKTIELQMRIWATYDMN